MLLCFYFSWITSVIPYWVLVLHSISCDEQTVMFVNALGVYIRPNFSVRLEKNCDARLIECVAIHMVHIGRIYLVIRTQNKGDVSIWGVEVFYIQVSFGPQQITVECKLWFQSSYMYLLSRHWTTTTCCLLQAVVSNGIYILCFRFLYVAYMHPLSCGRDIFVAYEKRNIWFPQADE